MWGESARRKLFSRGEVSILYFFKGGHNSPFNWKLTMMEQEALANNDSVRAPGFLCNEFLAVPPSSQFLLIIAPFLSVSRILIKLMTNAFHPAGVERLDIVPYLLYYSRRFLPYLCKPKRNILLCNCKYM